MKNILLVVHDDVGQEARLQAALDLTRMLNGHLTCVDVTVPPLATGGDFYGSAAQAVLVNAELDREATNKAAIERRLGQEGVPWNWVDAVDTLGSAVIDTASLADLIVLNSKFDSNAYPNMLDIVSRVVMQVDKPVVAVPETLESLPLRRVLIAWDGPPSCAATVRACVPLLALSEDVEIFMVREGANTTDPAEAAEYLSRHGIHPTINIVEGNRTPPDDLIANEAIRFNADYILMGAYGRGRAMEMFGGVTKRMLAGSKFPLILGH